VVNQSIIEVLEFRTLMSAAPMLFDAPVKVDRLVIRAELLKFRIDLAVCAAKLKVDGKAMARDGVDQVPMIAPLLATAKADLKSMQTALKVDRLTESANAFADESTIKLDIRQIILDRKNATAETADHAKLRNDRITLQNDLIAGLDSRIATRMTDDTTISTDSTAIVDAVDADTGASADLEADTAKFSAVEVASQTQFATDLANIASARTTLVNDLTAAQSS
jgi:hypothetical protein